MASIADNAFEIERRLINLKFNTNMPAGAGVLGYDGDPNAVNPSNSPGEELIYYVAQGATFMQSSGNLWFKEALPNTWVILSGSGGTSNTSLAIETIPPGGVVTMHTLDLSSNQSFDFSSEIRMLNNISFSKYSAVTDGTGSSMIWNEYSFLGDIINVDIDISVDGTGSNCLFRITNNETNDVTARVKVAAYYEL